MKLLEYFLIFSVAFLVYSASANDELSNKSTTSSVTATPVSETNSTTLEPATTVSNSTTSEPVTTTPTALTPGNTTSGNTTTSPAGESTTPAVVSTTTTESPESPDLMLVVNGSGIACIIAKLEISLTLEYKNENGSTVIGDYIIKSADVDSDKSSKCTSPDKDQEEELYADFSSDNTLYFLFNHTSTDKFAVTTFQLTSTDLRSLFPDATANQTLNLHSNETMFETSNKMSYKCNSEMKVDLMSANGMATNSSVTFKMVQVEAFRTTADTNFANAVDCEEDEINNIIPIAVGCALAGLVVIVLIAYLVGRRQKRQRGYESV